MKRKFVCSWPFLLALAMGSAGALPVKGENTNASPGTNTVTLEMALRLALENSPDLRASAGRVAAAAGRAYQAKLWSNPELELSAEDWPVDGGGFSDAKQTIGVAQTLPFPGKKSLDRKIGGVGVRLSEAALALRRVELVRDVKSAFYQVLSAERQVAVASELVGVAESSAETARKRVTAGAAADQEQLRAEISMEEARTELSAFQRELMTARQTLALLLGRSDLTGMSVAGVMVETPDLALLDQGTTNWLATHPSLVAATSGREQAELELRRAQLEPYPDVKVGVAGGRVGESGQSIIQLGFSVPLPIIDRSKGRRQEARANIRIAEAEQTAVENRLLRDWGIASQRFRVAAEQVASYRDRIVPKANAALRLVQTGFEQGKFGFIDLLDTQRTAAEARLAFQQKLLELNIAQAELEALLARTPVEFRSAPTL